MPMEICSREHENKGLRDGNFVFGCQNFIKVLKIVSDAKFTTRGWNELDYVLTLSIKGKQDNVRGSCSHAKLKDVSIVESHKSKQFNGNGEKYIWSNCKLEELHI